MSWIDHLKNLFENQWNQKYIVMGLDCDSMLCACIIKLRYPNAQIVGIYETEYMVQLQNGTKAEFREQFKKALWLDQDILSGFLCIGQHLITGDCLENIPLRNKNSFNPNEFFQQEYKDSFRTDSTTSKIDDATDCRRSSAKSKCPFSTAMLLLHFFDNFWKRNKYLDTFIMHGDSIGYNLLVYSTNCEAWRRLLFSSGSQINDLVCEMQKVYNKNWIPNCIIENHDCKKMNNCYCKDCSKKCQIRNDQRVVILRHFDLMANLQNIMQNYFDAESRKTSDMNGKNTKTEQKTNFKHLLGCEGEFMSNLKEKLGGSQGLKLKCRDEPKFGRNFDKTQFVLELNSFYNHTWLLLTGETHGNEFAQIQEYFVSKSETEGFGLNNGKTCVYLKSSNEWIPLHQFIIDRDIFSYAILNQKTIRFTQTGGVIDKP